MQTAGRSCRLAVMVCLGATRQLMQRVRSRREMVTLLAGRRCAQLVCKCVQPSASWHDHACMMSTQQVPAIVLGHASTRSLKKGRLSLNHEQRHPCSMQAVSHGNKAVTVHMLLQSFCTVLHLSADRGPALPELHLPGAPLRGQQCAVPGNRACRRLKRV